MAATWVTVSRAWPSMASVVRPADMRGCHHVGASGEMRRRHLVGRSAHVESGPGDCAPVEGGLERGLVDEVAAREIDQERVAAHEP